MEEVYRKGYVYIQEKFAGIIEETEDGYRFCYEDNYFSDENSVAVSLTMPISQKEYKSPVLFPFFDGLIPEGWLVGTKPNPLIVNLYYPELMILY